MEWSIVNMTDQNNECILINLAQFFANDERMNPIDFQIKVIMGKYGKLVNMIVIDSKLFSVFWSRFAHLLLMIRG